MKELEEFLKNNPYHQITIWHSILKDFRVCISDEARNGRTAFSQNSIEEAIQAAIKLYVKD